MVSDDEETNTPRQTSFQAATSNNASMSGQSNLVWKHTDESRAANTAKSLLMAIDTVRQKANTTQQSMNLKPNFRAFFGL